MSDLARKSTPEQIRERFDLVVERFSDLEAGQETAIDSALMAELIVECAARATPGARAALDIGCGAGNFSIRLARRLPGLAFTLIDLSRPMLDRACERLGAEDVLRVEAIQGDVRGIELGEGRFDIVLAAMVFHHLRGEDEWRDTFAKVHRALRPGGSFWIADMVAHAIPAAEAVLSGRYGAYLESRRGPEFRDAVFSYIAEEDSPRPLGQQLDWLREAGFRSVDVLHKNGLFAAFGAVR